MQAAFMVLNLVFGLLTCFFGYHLIRFWLASVGWQIGVAAVTTLAGNRIQGDAVLFAVAILAGFILALVFYSLFRPAIFAAGFLLFGYLAYLVLLALGQTALFWAAGLAGLGGGLLALLAHRPVLIFVTALGGALMVVDSAAALYLDRLPAPLLRLQTPIGSFPVVLYALALLALFMLGMVVQFRQGDNRSIPAGAFDSDDRTGSILRQRRTPYRQSRQSPDPQSPDHRAAGSGASDGDEPGRDTLRERRPPDGRSKR